MSFSDHLCKFLRMFTAAQIHRAASFGSIVAIVSRVGIIITVCASAFHGQSLAAIPNRRLQYSLLASPLVLDRPPFFLSKKINLCRNDLCESPTVSRSFPIATVAGSITAWAIANALSSPSAPAVLYLLRTSMIWITSFGNTS